MIFYVELQGYWENIDIIHARRRCNAAQDRKQFRRRVDKKSEMITCRGNRTGSVFTWSKQVRYMNGLISKRHLNSGQKIYE